MAVLAVQAAGAAFGSAFLPSVLGVSGAGLGWTAAGLLFGMTQTQKTQGPRLDNLKLTASTYGAPIPYVIAHPRIGGQVIWGSDRREISTTTSRRAKGGPKVKSTTFTYEIDLLIKLTCNEMAGIRKIFINGELQWTSASNADYGSIAASGSLATRVTVYTGADDQLPDPTYEAAVGIGNAPAYRGALTIMLEGLQLGNSGQIPNITFEVMQTAEESINTAIIGSSTALTEFGFTGAPIMGPEGSTIMVGLWTNTYATTAADVYRVNPDGVVQLLRRVNVPAAAPIAFGSSDEPVIVTWQTFNSYATWEDGTATSFPIQAPVFAKEGDTFVACTLAPIIFKYDIAGLRGDPAVAAIQEGTVAPPAAIGNMVIHDGALYALQAGAGTRALYVYDLETLALLNTITTPVITANSTMLFDDVGDLHIVAATTLFRYDGTAWETARSIPTGYGSGATAQHSGALIDDVLYSQYFVPSGGLQPVQVRASWVAADAGERDLGSVVEEICIRAGVDPSFIDVSSLVGHVVRAYAITPSASRAVLEVLMQAYHFEAVCADALRFVSLGGASAASIDFIDLGTTAPGNFVEPLPINERNDPEMPAHITIKYMNVINDFQDGAERSSRIATESEAEEFRELPLGMLPSEAKQAADFAANITQMSLTTVSFAVQLKHFNLQPTDVAIVQDRDGSTYRVRIMKAGWAKGIYQIDAVFDSASSVISDGLTDEDYEENNQIRVPSTTIYVLGDWPLFRDEDDNIGHYWAATGAGDFWTGAALLKSSDDVVYQQVSQIEERGIVGTALTALANYTGPNIPDEGNSVRVSIGLGTAASITYEQQITETTGAWMIGAECVIARVATYVSPGVYDLRGLLRGRKGTEWAMGTHAAGEDVAYIQPAGMRRVGMDLAELDIERYYRAVTFTKSLDSAPSEIWANTGVSSRPYAPTNLDADRDALAGTTTIFWNRRTRLSQAWWLGNVPLGEEGEVWHIYRYTNNTYTTLAEPMVTSNTASYTFAVSGTVYVRIAQVSARVGEGYFLQGAV